VLSLRLPTLQTLRVTRCEVTAKICPHGQLPTDAPYVTSKYQQFTSDAPCSSSKNLIVLTRRLLRNLHTISLAKAVPDGLKDRECKKITLCKCTPIPYVPEKDCVQQTVSAFKDNHLKMQIGKGMEL
jgi:hypothetical protein